MYTETRHEDFEKHSFIGQILRKLHIDIPLFVTLVLISILSFVILYSAGGQSLDVLIRQAMRVALAFVLMIFLAHIDLPPVLIELFFSKLPLKFPKTQKTHPSGTNVS